MPKVVMLLWIMLADGTTTGPIEYTGWKSLSHCEQSAWHFTEGVPLDKEKVPSDSYAIIATCEVR